jgi:hypothetical protein
MMAFPLPPDEILDKHTNTAGQAVMMFVIAGGLLTLYAAALWLRQRLGTWVPLAVALGATFCALLEPLPDVVANLWYYAPEQKSIYSSYGNSMPVWTFFSYAVYYGGIGLVLWWLVEQGWTRRKLVVLCLPLYLYLGGGELFFMHVLELYTYHGPGAFKVADYPAWIPLMNLTIVLWVGIGAALIRRSLPARDQLVPAFLLPGVAMVVGLIGGPMATWSAIHSDDPSDGLVWGTTVVTIVIELGLMYSAMRLIPATGFSPMVEKKPAAPAVPQPAAV